MKLLPLVLLLSIAPLTLTEVVKDFGRSKCSKFFFRGSNKKSIITPTAFKGNQYKQICQHWNKVYRFATLYDTQRRIPVYSAYILTVQKEKMNLSLPENNRKEEWKNEPQLENIKNSPDMRKISDAEMDTFFHQAVNRDYTESSKYTNVAYTRGHVFPRQYAANEDQADSTFTFTNVAPQRNYSNTRWAEQVETRMKREIKNKCPQKHTHPAYILTGVVPGSKFISIRRNINNKPKTIDKGINIPSYFWTAFCCVTNNTTFSKAYVSLQNDPNDQTHELIEMSVNILNSHLTRLYKQDFRVYGRFCLT
ncbi:endonuclease domain-containing 1 protein-like [Silurus meridionalis]|uniref:endonuclease domain-containing 1 protein-like n=1 Tax=Silurus meridionalis TaxID=175797 RepID=UPI001EE9E7E2|nr:endonuclease domain-containing 1 protein-like [Silurus meridionalis]XP_046712570.1 endonuclease domain-containing 1 protein-like [Silurus meridionalis]